MSTLQWWVQAIVIATVVLWALQAALRRLLPVPSRRWQARVVEALAALPLPSPLRSLVLRAQQTATSGASCGDGCSACGGCGAAGKSAPAAAVDTGFRPLVFRPRVASAPPK